MLLWLWCRPEAEALIRPPAWEFPYAESATLKRPKKKKSIYVCVWIFYIYMVNYIMRHRKFIESNKVWKVCAKNWHEACFKVRIGWEYNLLTRGGTCKVTVIRLKKKKKVQVISKGQSFPDNLPTTENEKGSIISG